MDARTFDSWTRRAARLLTRRAVAGGALGAVLGAILPPRATSAKGK